MEPADDGSASQTARVQPTRVLSSKWREKSRPQGGRTFPMTANASTKNTSIAELHPPFKGMTSPSFRHIQADLLRAPSTKSRKNLVKLPPSRTSSMRNGADLYSMSVTSSPAPSFPFPRKSSAKKSSVLETREQQQKQHLLTSQVMNRLKRNGRRQNAGRRVRGLMGSPMTYLRRGGVHLETTYGPIQFGMPPETIKDVLLAGLPTPITYVVPKERFNLELGVSCAELEFPMFYCFFILQQSITLITDRDTEKDLDIIHREATIGPEPQYLYAEREYSLPDSKHKQPNHEKEIEHFKAPGDMISYKFFENGRSLELGTKEEGNLVIIMDSEADFQYEVFDFGKFQSLRRSRKKTKSRRSHLIPKFKTMMAKGGKKTNDDMDLEMAQMEKDLGVLITNPHEVFRYVRATPSLQSHIAYHVVTYDEAERIGNQHNVDENNLDAGISLDEESDYGIDEQLPTRARRAPEKIKRQIRIHGDFKIPEFGVTILGNSHGFDMSGTTTGFVLWINGEGIMVDPPPHSSYVLQQYGIRPKTITAIILTHCHADHDAGTFQKMITDHKVQLITSATIYHSFVRKYSALSGLDVDFIKALFDFRAVYLEEPNHWKGAKFRFFYSLHSIPCIGFEVTFQGKSIVYSADTFYVPQEITRLKKEGVLSEGRANSLLDFPFHCDVVLHEAGVPPLHTPLSSFLALPREKRNKIHLVHIGKEEAKEAEKAGLKVAKPGVENTIAVIQPKNEVNLVKWLKIISSMEVFEHFKVDKALDLVLMAEHKVYAEGEVIQGYDEINKTTRNPGKFMIIVAGRGFASVSRTKVSRVLSEGDYFGEFVFVSQDENRETSESNSTEMQKSQGTEFKSKSKKSNDNNNSNRKARLINLGEGGEAARSTYTHVRPPASEFEEPLFINMESRMQPSKSAPEPDARLDDDDYEDVLVGGYGHVEDWSAEESFVAETHLEVLELDFFAVKSLLLQDDILFNKFDKILDARYGTDYRTTSWEAIQGNGILQGLRLEQKLELQLSLVGQELTSEQTPFITKEDGTTAHWEKGKPVEFAILVASGSLYLRGDNNEEAVISPGMMVFEYSNIKLENLTKSNDSSRKTDVVKGPKKPAGHGFTLKSHAPESVIYTINRVEFVKFMDKNPHLLLAFFKSAVVL